MKIVFRTTIMLVIALNFSTVMASGMPMDEFNNHFVKLDDVKGFVYPNRDEKLTTLEQSLITQNVLLIAKVCRMKMNISDYHLSNGVLEIQSSEESSLFWQQYIEAATGHLNEKSKDISDCNRAIVCRLENTKLVVFLGYKTENNDNESPFWKYIIEFKKNDLNPTWFGRYY